MRATRDSPPPQPPPPPRRGDADAPSSSSRAASVDFACGVVAGFFYTLSAHPFDTVKVAMQTAPHTGASAPSALATARAIASAPGPGGGIRALYKGLSAPLLGYSLEGGLNYGVVSQTRQWLTHRRIAMDERASADPPTSSGAAAAAAAIADVAISGAVGGAVLSLVVAPTDLIKCQVQDGQFASAREAVAAGGRLCTYLFTAHTSRRRTYSHRSSPLDRIDVKLTRPTSIDRVAAYERDGIRGLFRGTFATMLREIPGNALFFATYELAQSAFPRWTRKPARREDASSTVAAAGDGGSGGGAAAAYRVQEALAAIACGGVAGSAFWLAVLPIDGAKTR
ncbi:mitochondrial carrier family [Micromonas pusilla CCMP1545]|jgi:solute carrier family 25 (mitochondrial carnitine/acylcarnitine transporter), member 20/29|uniref:Mitochondrial carrier family n=1 Tax=Micromonas pusilla (strain CCMP1545) TaxID=564608 RepID=C1MJG7_MICPC|nr:mitochondrial carrier family [Micromonas pusilla CCMP1545]EEH59587.1 mitochondrial carrier family [Micromonas pusilla CCMP1545]|eukprot:XP_003056211.1 mitochondrial carrier family [Micromonas pusilla CCMP1545]